MPQYQGVVAKTLIMPESAANNIMNILTKLFNTTSTLVVTVYLILSLASLIFFIIEQSNKFASIFIVLLTLPWSFAITEMLYRFGFDIKSIFLNSCLFVFCVFINSFLIYLFLNLVLKKSNSRKE